VKIATWNVNGIRARGPEVVAFLEAEAPDILCLQEIKAAPNQLHAGVFTGEKAEKPKAPKAAKKSSKKASADADLFSAVPAPAAREEEEPGLSAAELAGLLPGYVSAWHGDKGYSGVSIHVRAGYLEAAGLPRTLAAAPPPFDFETRVLVAEIGTITFVAMYAPNGGKDYGAKLRFWDALAPWAKAYAATHPSQSLVIAGDLNIAHTDNDIHPSHRKVGSDGLPPIGIRVEERERFSALLATGLTDVTRALHPDADRLFSWWPYWAKARERNLGWRIDYILAGMPAKTAEVLAKYGTSDHAPLVATFA